MSRCAAAERGLALLVVLMAMSMLMALGLALTTVTMGESAVASGYGQGLQAYYAAESACDYALQALAREPDWQAVVEGDRSSVLNDDAVVDVIGADAPPTGVLYAYGWLSDLMPADAALPRLAVAAWVADGGDEATLLVTGRAYGANGSRREIEMRVERAEPPEDRLRVVSWREVR